MLAETTSAVDVLGLVNAGFTLATVMLGWFSLQSWRAQMRAEVNGGKARELLRAALRVREAVRGVREPIQTHEEALVYLREDRGLSEAEAVARVVVSDPATWR